MTIDRYDGLRGNSYVYWTQKVLADMAKRLGIPFEQLSANFESRPWQPVHLIVSHYHCRQCGAVWEASWDSACDDECGVCGITLSPMAFADDPDCDCPACLDKRQNKDVT